MMATGNWDWNYAIPIWDWHELVLNEYPGWEKDGEHPASITLTFKRGERESRDVAIKWDDHALAAFYYKDFTSDNLPFVSMGEHYTATFWFQKKSELTRFRKYFRL